MFRGLALLAVFPWGLAVGQMPPAITAGGKDQAAWTKQLQQGRTPDEKVEAARVLGSFVPSRTAVYALLQAVDDPRTEVKVAALGALQSYGVAAIPILVQATKSEDGATAYVACLILSQLDRAARSAAPHLVRGLQPDVPADSRDRIAGSLINMNNPDVIPLLKPLLSHKDVITRYSALRVLAAMQVETDAVNQAITELLGSEDRFNRFLALNAINILGPDAASQGPGVVKLLQDADPDPRIRHAAVVALKRIGRSDKATSDALIKTMKDEVPEVRSQAAKTAWSLTRDKNAFSTFQDLLKSDHKPTQLLAVQALWGAKPDDKSWLPVLLELAELENEIGEQALFLMARIGTEAAAGAAVAAGHLNETGKPIPALAALARLGPVAKKYTPAILNLAEKGRDGTLRARAATALWLIDKNPRGLEILLKLLDDRDAAIKQLAARSLFQCAPLPKETAAKLLDCLDCFDSPEQLSLAWALSESGEVDAGRRVLTRLLRDPIPDVRISALSTLGILPHLDRSPVKEITLLLWDPEETLAAFAAETLGRIGKSAHAAIPELILKLQLRDAPDNAYSSAADTLGLFGPAAKDALPHLKKLLDHPDGYVRVNAAFALWRIGQDKSGVAQLEAGLHGRSAVTQAFAAEALWQIRREPKSLPLLLGLLDQYEPEAANERYIAARAFGRMAPADAKAAIPLLKRAARDVDRDLSLMAGEALKSIESAGKR